MSTPGWSTISEKNNTVNARSEHTRRPQQNEVEVAAPTELLHALLVRFIQEEIALLHSTMDLKTQAQAGIFHQL